MINIPRERKGKRKTPAYTPRNEATINVPRGVRRTKPHKNRGVWGPARKTSGGVYPEEGGEHSRCGAYKKKREEERTVTEFTFKSRLGERGGAEHPVALTV